MEGYLSDSSDSDDSFLFQHQTTNPAIRKKKLNDENGEFGIGIGNVPRRSLSSPSKSRSDDLDEKENRRIWKRNTDISTSKKRFVLRPPPSLHSNSNKDAGVPLYCSRILQPKQLNRKKDAKSGRPVFHEFTCDCCREDNAASKQQRISKNSKKKQIVDKDDLSSSSIECLESSFEDEIEQPIRYPSRTLNDKIRMKRRMVLEEDDDDDDEGVKNSFIASSSDESIQEEGDNDAVKEVKIPLNKKSIGGKKCKSQQNTNDTNEKILDEILAQDNSKSKTGEDTNIQQGLPCENTSNAKPNTKKPKTSVPKQFELIDLMNSDASSYSGSDNSFLDQKPAPRPKKLCKTNPQRSKTKQPSYRSKIQRNATNIWDMSYDSSSIDSSYSSDSDEDSKGNNRSTIQRKRAQTAKDKVKEIPSRVPAIHDILSSSDDEDIDWGYAKPGEGKKSDLVDLMKRVGLNDHRKKTGKKSAPTKTKNTRTGHDPLAFNDESSLEALLSVDEDSSSEEDIQSKSKGLPRNNKNVKPTAKPAFKRKPSSSKLFNCKPIVKQTSNKEFKSNRDTIAKDLFKEYDRKAFDGKLASVELVWSNKLQKTAGLTRLITKTFFEKVDRYAKIELATKIIDDMERLKSTLLHEMCHAAQWLVDGVAKPAHGKVFQKWSKLAMSKVPGVVVTVTHTYEIQYKYAWACTAEGCSFVVKRQSRSVDVTKQCCGRCKGRLVEVEVPKKDKNGGDNKNISIGLTPKKSKPVSAYNLFVKDHSKTVREKLEREHREKGILLKVAQAEVLKECGRLWKEHKEEQKRKM